MNGPFRSLWKEALEECLLERIPRFRLRALARIATEADMRFLLDEGARIEKEWEAIRGHDAGDVSDDYWRMATCVAETFRFIGARASPFLLAQVSDLGSSHRLAAARLLGTVAAKPDRGRIEAALAKEADPLVRAALAGALKAAASASPWWRFWRR